LSYLPWGSGWPSTLSAHPLSRLYRGKNDVPPPPPSARRDLGKLAPELIDAYRAGKIGLEAVSAFTLGADHAAQLAVWRRVSEHSYPHASTVRRLLTESAVPLDSDLGMFVGAAAYEAAGGHVTRDLFSGDEDGFLDDPALVHRLAIEKLEAKAGELRSQWAWTKAELDPEYGFLTQYGRVRPQPAEAPPELAEIERIEQRLGELEEIDGDHWTDGLAVYTDQDRARAGCIVAIGEDGEFRLYEGLTERSAARGSAGADAGDQPDDDHGFDAAGSDDGDEIENSRPSRASAEQRLRKDCGFSQSLVDDLKAHRLQITRAHLAGNFEVAFDLALYALCVDLFDRLRYHANPLDLRLIEATPRSSLNDLAGTPAHRLLEAQKNALALDWQKLPAAESFAALSALPGEDKQRLLAWCVAAGLKPQLAIEDRADPAIESAGRRLAIPFADYWRPAAVNYWGRAKKAHSLAVGAEIHGHRWARDHVDDKKAVLAAALETAFGPQKSGACIGLGQAARDSVAAWLAPGIGYAAANSAETPPDADTLPADDPEGAETPTVDIEGADLPAFLVEDEPAHPALNGAAVS
jgi:ParB family chromosome partitioning protein